MKLKFHQAACIFVNLGHALSPHRPHLPLLLSLRLSQLLRFCEFVAFYCLAGVRVAGLELNTKCHSFFRPGIFSLGAGAVGAADVVWVVVRGVW